ncbi:MAG: hypothetical protein C3F07_02765 [Anaerolineales bacterium]|nr:MAG: hypothetical protein C3F07_02765 [Anaerolineales bacterium]
MLPGVDDKGELLGSFELADQILWGLEHGIPEDRLRDSFGQELFLRIRTLYELSRPMREVPYTLD